MITSSPNRSGLRTFILLASVLVSIAALAATRDGSAIAARAAALLPVPAPVLTSNELLGEAVTDECFAGVGVDYPLINPDGTCPEGTPKTNESYIWGLTEEAGKLWFGTMANTACIIDGQASTDPIQNSVVVCEFGLSQYARMFPGIPASLGDWRPPSIYEYDLATDTLVNRELDDPLISRTIGLRGAGSIDNIAFLGGANLFADSVNIFAFNAATGEYLGSCEHASYNYMRAWADVDGVLYVGAGSAAGGAVLRWDGDAASFDGNFCDDFTEVGHMTANAANVTRYTGADGQGRLAVTTVPIRTASGGTGIGVGVWISPRLGPGGLTAEDADLWRQAWSPTSYDPDRIVSLFGYSGGAVQYFDGWLYWGTIHLQNSGARRVHSSCTLPICFGTPTTPEQQQALSDGVYRTASVWRGRNLESAQNREIQLLYGESELPASNGPGSFAMAPTGWTPLYGPSGFGNRSNEYIWTMAVFDSRLFVGTYDAAVLQGSTSERGADLWRFDTSNSPAVNENFQGLGDRLNYGIRAMQALDDQSGVVVGLANPFNLAPGGGWELRRLKETTPP